MNTTRYFLIAAVMLVATSCGDSKDHGPDYLFVQTSAGVFVNNNQLTFVDVGMQTGWFTDRPYREAGQIPTEEFASLWDVDSENLIGPSTTRGPFADNPPNAEFTCTVNGEVVNYAVELKQATLPPLICGSTYCALSYRVTFLGPNIVEPYADFECDGTGHLFIDDAEAIDLDADGYFREPAS